MIYIFYRPRENRMSQKTAKPAAKDEVKTTAAPAPTAQKSQPAATAVKKAAARPEAATAPEKTKAATPRKQAPRKPKLIRDSFTIPENEYALFSTLKERAMAAGVEVKKSELLRAGLACLAGLREQDFVAAVRGVERIKAGRPRN